jgi:beta-ribofuranosylaminobenzene 5'-phosphate synthase
VTRIVAPSRLHFGLLSLPSPDLRNWPGLDGAAGLPIRQFGGVGLTIDNPGLAIRVSPSSNWSAGGPLAARALAFARLMSATLPAEERRCFHIVVERCPTEHSGLGVGTQLGMAVARGIAIELGHAEWPATELAKRVGRGERSAIGVLGFDRGGLLVEGGKLPGEPISPLVGRFEFPEEWTILLFTPPGASRWHGGLEADAFARLAGSIAETDALCRLILMGMLPALASANLDAFGESLYEFNARSGEVFAPLQGGRYASPAIADCVSRLRRLGIRGVGQSSWGPTVFAVIPKDQVAAVGSRLSDIPFAVANASTGAVAE